MSVQIPEPERWPAYVVLMLTGLQDIRAEMRASLNTNATAAQEPVTMVAPITPQTSETNTLKAFVRANIRVILLRNDLDSYGRHGGRKNHAANTPFSLLKVSITT